MTNKKRGFTLAEILISLLILGVIASLTIPSLIQNTHKKEEQVKVKKGISVLNQALSTHYALTKEDFSSYCTKSEINACNYSQILENIFKKRLSLADSGINGDVAYFITGDGLFFAMGHDYTYSGINELTILLYTKRPNNIPASDMDVVDDMTQGDTIARGVFTIFCKEHSCYPSPYNTAIFLNAKDPAKLKLNPDIESSEKYIEE